MIESGDHGLSLVESMIVLFVLGRRHLVDRLEQPPIVESVNPFNSLPDHRSDLTRSRAYALKTLDLGGSGSRIARFNGNRSP